MTSREQFELVWKGSEISDDDTLKQIAWAFWQASREAVEVELPTAEPDGGTDSQVDISAGFSNRMRSKCIESIRSAGIKVKGE